MSKYVTAYKGVPIADKEVRQKVKTVEENQIELVEDETGMEGVSDKTYDTLQTTDKTLIGGINEVCSQLKDIANLSLTKHTDGKVYIKKQDGTLIGTGIELPTDADLSKITMSVSGNTLKLLNNGEQITTVDLPEGSGDVPSNVVLFEEVEDTNEEIPIPIKSSNGTTYYLHVDNNGIPFVKNVSGTTIWEAKNTGGSTEPSKTYYNITNNLTNCTSSNSATTIEKNTSYNTTISANNNYTISSITVTMGGTDVSSTVLSGNTISIPSVTGNVVIIANATEIVADDNLINFETLITSGSMPDGAKIQGNMKCTDFIPVTPSTSYYTSLCRNVDAEGTVQNYNQKYYQYDSSKTYIKVTALSGNRLPSIRGTAGTVADTHYVKVLFDDRYTTVAPYYGLSES